MRLIDADALEKDANEDLLSNPDTTDEVYWNDGAKSIIDLIKTAPTIDPVKHGKWINDKGLYMCSVCNNLWTHWWAVVVPEERMYEEMKYCPNCGAQMERSEDGEVCG